MTGPRDSFWRSPSSWYVRGLWNGRLAFRVAEGEARYVRAAEVARSLPSNAVVISNLHSGSVRYYADRLTLRSEWLGVDAYGPALRYLRDQGRLVYAMLDDTEVDTFRQLGTETREMCRGSTSLRWSYWPIGCISISSPKGVEPAPHGSGRTLVMP
jgi:hypothetical protein